MQHIRDIRALCKKHHPFLNILKGKGYYYFTSDDDTLSLKLNALESTSVYVSHWSQLTKEQWEEEIRDVLKRCENLD